MKNILYNIKNAMEEVNIVTIPYSREILPNMDSLKKLPTKK